MYLLIVPDRRTYAVNAFSLAQTNALYYIYPQFSMLEAVLEKIWLDQNTSNTECATIHQSWYPHIHVLHLM